MVIGLGQEPRYCDRNLCVSNDYNGIGCEECEVTKSQEPKTGHWIETDYEIEKVVRGYCSVCGWESNYYEDDVVGMNYCPNCGCRMVEPQESEDKE